MAIAAKRKRKIRVLERDFVWHSNDEWMLHIASVDKKFVIAVPIVFYPWREWPGDFLPLLVSGSDFPGLDRQKDMWIKCFALTPQEMSTTPAIVRRLIEWSLSEEKEFEVIKNTDTGQRPERD